MTACEQKSILRTACRAYPADGCQPVARYLDYVIAAAANPEYVSTIAFGRLLLTISATVQNLSGRHHQRRLKHTTHNHHNVHNHEQV
jgi:hypothetical protein